MRDPTRNEMLTFLAGFDPSEWINSTAKRQSIGSPATTTAASGRNLYSALSTSPFSPGPLANGSEPDSMGEYCMAN